MDAENYVIQYPLDAVHVDKFADLLGNTPFVMCVRAARQIWNFLNRVTLKTGKPASASTLSVR